jgi:mono/diheme cytochrome c family protein
MRIAASGRTINAPSGAVINMGHSFMKIKSILAIAIFLGASFWLGRPESHTRAWAGARPVGGAPAEASYESKTPGALTFSKDVAPIIFNNCASCHRPDAVAPFSLLSYQEVKKRAKQIAYVTDKRIMPPWKADQGDYEFKDARRLTGEQIGMIRRWVEAGAPEGDPKDAPSPPTFTDGWRLGKPDLIVKMSEAYSVPADGPDIYRNFALPLDLAEDKWVKAIEFRPGARPVVHHSLFFYDATGSARKQDEDDPLPGYSGGMGGLPRGIINLGSLRRVASGQAAPVGGLGGWADGAQARLLPEGLAWYLPKDADLILATHFHPSGKPEKEISTIGLYFADKAPTKKFTGIQLPPLFSVFKGIDIPAGVKDYAIEDSFTLPVDVKAFGVSAHAHYLAKEMKLTARLPGGQTRTLLWISDWDFAWQDQYQFKEFVSLPKGTRLDVKITYDNSADNPRNPASPPKRVRWGEGSNDEMGGMGLSVVASDEAEMPQLQQAYRQHVWSALTSREGMSSLRGRANSSARQ